MGRVTASDSSAAQARSREQAGRGPSWAGPTKLPSSASLALPCCAPGCARRRLTGQGRLFEGDEHRAHPRDILALLAALGVEITELGHLLPLGAWGFLLGLLQECFLRGPEEKLGVVTGRILSKETPPLLSGNPSCPHFLSPCFSR